MFETNSASCGGFVGISDSFGAALWGLDYAMQMAFSNFSASLFHVGGQSVFYNPFTRTPLLLSVSLSILFSNYTYYPAPPTNQSTYRQWTIGPIYYSALVMAEALGSSNATQIVDLLPNNANIYTPAYSIYENGNLARILLFNYVTDPSGASDLTVQLNLNGAGGSSAGPSQIQVKYLQASSVAQKGNFTWANQVGYTCRVLIIINRLSSTRLSVTTLLQTVD